MYNKHFTNSGVLYPSNCIGSESNAVPSLVCVAINFSPCLVDVNALGNGISHPERRFAVLCNVLKMRKTAPERIAVSTAAAAMLALMQQ